jgi:hypothetical protein
VWFQIGENQDELGENQDELGENQDELGENILITPNSFV